MLQLWIIGERYFWVNSDFIEGNLKHKKRRTNFCESILRFSDLGKMVFTDNAPRWKSTKEITASSKIKKQALYFELAFFQLFVDLFVTQTYECSNFIEVIELIYNYSVFKSITVLKPKCSKDVLGSVAILEDTL